VPTWTKPVTLTANTNENVNDLNATLDDIYARANGGLDETNVPNLTAAFTTYKRLARATAALSNPGGTLLMSLGNVSSAGAVNVAAGNASASPGDFAIHLDPAIYNANARTTKLAIRAAVFTNAVAPAVNYLYALFPIATYGGASGATPTIASLGAAVTGSSITINTPAAAGPTTLVSTDFNFPAAGFYVLGIVPSGAATAGSVQAHVAQLEMRQV
jgi:hypothetical protein